MTSYNINKMSKVAKITFFTVVITILINNGVCFPTNHTAHSQRDKRSKQFVMVRGEKFSFTKEEIKQKFEEYYDCINKENEEFASRRESIKAIVVLEAQRVELPCRICVRPGHEGQNDDKFWQVVRTHDGTMKILRKSTKKFKVDKEMTLLIKRVDVTDAGQYFCVHGKEPANIYQVDVLFKEPQKSVSENDTKSLQPRRKLIEHNLEVFSQWTEWGECDHCGKDARRLKFGTCMVRKTASWRPTTPVDVPILSLYPDGVPCRSTVLSRQMAHFPGVKGRQSEVLFGHCFVPCPSPPPAIEVTDTSGKVVDIIEAGYEPLHRKPDIPAMVIRKVEYKDVGTYEILTCPTSDTGKVRWQRGERPIDTETIREKTRGRVFVDRLNRLHFRQLRMRDTAAYSCWVWQRHVATIKVIVFEAMNADIKHMITYGGLFLTVFILLLYCTCKFCFGKPKRARGS